MENSIFTDSYPTYVDLLATIRETNRPPGGKQTVARLARRLSIGPGTRVLEIGSNTGFTSVELVKQTACQAYGIDVNESAVREAEQWRMKLAGALGDRVSFQVGDAVDLPFDDGFFDVVVCGGANTFVRHLDQAFSEYRRVLRPYGSVSITNLYYRQNPPPELLQELENVLGFSIPVYGLSKWLETFLSPGWEMFDLSTSDLTSRSEETVDAYVSWLCNKNRISCEPNQRESVRSAWARVIKVFNRNHDYLSYLELTLRKEELDQLEQPELFLRPGAYDPFFSKDFLPAFP